MKPWHQCKTQQSIFLYRESEPAKAAACSLPESVTIKTSIPLNSSDENYSHLST